MVKITNSGIAIDPVAESEGRWMDTPWDGVQFKIAGSQTPRYYSCVRNNLRRRNCATLNELSTEAQDEVLCEALGEACLVDWKGLKSGDVDLEYSVANAIDILKSRTYVRIRDFVSYKAALLSSFDVENIEEISKN